MSSADPPKASGFPPLSLREQWLTDQASVLETCLSWQELHFWVLSLCYLTLQHLLNQHKGSGQRVEAIKSPFSFFLSPRCVSLPSRFSPTENKLQLETCLNGYNLLKWKHT